MVEGRLALELPFLMFRAPRALLPRALPRLDKLLPLVLPPGGGIGFECLFRLGTDWALPPPFDKS